MNSDKMEHLCSSESQNVMKCSALEVQCDELNNELQQDENAFAETMMGISKYRKIAKSLINELNGIRLRNQKGQKTLNSIQMAVGKLGEHSELQTERSKDLLATNETSSKQIKTLAVAHKDVSSGNKTLKSQMDDLKSEPTGQAAEMVQKAAFIEAKRDSRKSDIESQLEQSRVNDATIQANENELALLMAAADQKKDELARAGSQRGELEHKIEQMGEQMRLMAQNIDHLRVARKQCATDQQASQKLDLEKSSLRKEIDFYSKTAREQTTKSSASNAVSKSVQAKKVVSSASASKGLGHVVAVEVQNDIVRDIEKIRPMPSNTTEPPGSSHSSVTDIDGYDDNDEE